MISYIDAAFFLKAMLKPNKKIATEVIQLADDQTTLMADVYRPEASSQGVILLVHGMTPYGYRDARMVKLGRAAATCGYTAVIPSFPLIKQGLIDVSSIGRVILAIKAITADVTLCPEQSLLMFTASFSGVICVAAASDESVNTRVNSLMIVGGCFNSLKTFQAVFSNPRQDPYARLVLYKNLAKKTIAADHVLERAMACAIEDAYDETKRSDAYHHYIVHLDKTDRARVVEFIEPVLSGRVSPLVQYNQEAHDIAERFSSRMMIQQLRCRVVLVHSETDDVIPPAESVALYHQLLENHIEARLLITPLLAHATFSFRVKLILGVGKMILALNDFLSAGQ